MTHLHSSTFTPYRKSNRLKRMSTIIYYNVSPARPSDWQTKEKVSRARPSDWQTEAKTLEKGVAILWLRVIYTQHKTNQKASRLWLDNFYKPLYATIRNDRVLLPWYFLGPYIYYRSRYSIPYYAENEKLNIFLCDLMIYLAKVRYYNSYVIPLLFIHSIIMRISRFFFIFTLYWFIMTVIFGFFNIKLYYSLWECILMVWEAYKAVR